MYKYECLIFLNCSFRKKLISIILVLLLFLVAQSCLSLCDPMDCNSPDSSVHANSPGKNTGSHALLQGVLPTQGSNPGLLHYRQILYHLSHQGSLSQRVLPSFEKILAVPTSRPWHMLSSSSKTPFLLWSVSQ